MYVCYMNELILYIHFIFPIMCFIPIPSPFRTATYLAWFFEDHTSHLASRLSSMERDAKAAADWRGRRMTSPVEKSSGKQKRWQQLLNFQIVFFFLSSMFIFWDWRIFERIKWQIFNHGLFEALKVRSTAKMWGATGILTTHDPGAQDPDVCWIMVGRWKWFEMEINEDLRLDYCEWENLECLFQRHFDVEAFFVFWRSFLDTNSFDDVYLFGNSSTFWGSLNFAFLFFIFLLDKYWCPNNGMNHKVGLFEQNMSKTRLTYDGHTILPCFILVQWVYGRFPHLHCVLERRNEFSSEKICELWLFPWHS